MEIDTKMEKATEMRENQLEKVKSIAQKSAEKKKPSSENTYLAHENMTLPVHSQHQPPTTEQK
jgi:hypothetical protein